MRKHTPAVLPILPYSGLGNMMLVWAEACVFSNINSLPMIQPFWHPIHIGPVLRGERDKRNYSNTFTNDSLGNRIKLHLMIKFKLADVYYNPPVSKISSDILDASKNAKVFIFNQLPAWQDYFKNIREHQALIKNELMKIVNPKILKSLEKRRKPQIGVHVRLGDYREVSDNNYVDFSIERNVRNPLSWYVRVIKSLRQELGFSVKVTVFSDGHIEELEPLLKLENVEFSDQYSALVDLLTLSDSSIIISSSHSTFSGWASFLGQVPTIHYPKRFSLYQPILSSKLRKKVFEDGYDPEIMEMPKLLKDNLRERLL